MKLNSVLLKVFTYAPFVVVPSGNKNIGYDTLDNVSWTWASASMACDGRRSTNTTPNLRETHPTNGQDSISFLAIKLPPKATGNVAISKIDIWFDITNSGRCDDSAPCTRTRTPTTYSNMRIKNRIYATDARPRGNKNIIGNWITTNIQNNIKRNTAVVVLKIFWRLTRPIICHPHYHCLCDRLRYIRRRRHLRATRIQKMPATF